jgi:UDP-2,4-diacetamido-2,4,6-trideoxy-beta-L-altropyranose hydrolase
LKNVIFIIDVDTGKHAGTGHLFRSLKIYKILKETYKKKIKIYFLFKNLEKSNSIIRKYIKENLIIFDNNFEKKISFLKKNDLIINDTPYEIEKNFKNYLLKKNFKNLVLIDHKKIKNDKNWIYINGIYSYKKNYPKNKRIYQGSKFVLLDKKFEKYNLKKRDNNVIISTGGTDTYNLNFKIFNKIKKLNFNKIYIVVGPGFSTNNPIFSIKDNRVKLLKNKDNLYKYFFKSNISIVTGGITMFESIASLNYTFVYQSYAHQKYAINKMKKSGVVQLIGKLDRFYDRKLLMSLNKIFIGKKPYKFILKKRIIDGKALSRLKKILFYILDKSI